MAAYFIDRLAPIGTSQPYLSNTSAQLLTIKDSHAELVISLTKIVETFPPDGVWRHSIDGPAGLLQGASGIAYVSCSNDSGGLHMAGKLPIHSLADLPPSRLFRPIRRRCWNETNRMGFTIPRRSTYPVQCLQRGLQLAFGRDELLRSGECFELLRIIP